MNYVHFIFNVLLQIIFIFDLADINVIINNEQQLRHSKNGKDPIEIQQNPFDNRTHVKNS